MTLRTASIRTLVAIVLALLSLAASRSAAQTTIFSDGFEGAFPGAWSVGNDGGITSAMWGDNNFMRYSGTWSAFCADNGSNSRNTYDNNLHTFMERRGVSLFGYSSATLTFKYWINTQASLDYFTVNIRNQSGGWTQVFLTSGNQSSSGWQSRSIDLSPWAGQSGLYVQFRFDSDNSVVPAAPSGVWVDDVVLVGSLSPCERGNEGTPHIVPSIQGNWSAALNVREDPYLLFDWQASGPYRIYVQGPTGMEVFLCRDGQQVNWGLGPGVELTGNLGFGLHRLLLDFPSIQFSSVDIDLPDAPLFHIPVNSSGSWTSLQGIFRPRMINYYAYTAPAGGTLSITTSVTPFSLTKDTDIVVFASDGRTVVYSDACNDSDASYTTNVLQGQVVYFAIAGNRCESNTFNYSITVNGPPCQPPPAPTNVQASDGTYCDRVEVSWAGVSGANGYDVLRDGTQIGSPASSPYSDSTASPGVTYQYAVRARNACGTGSASATNSGYRAAPPTSAPTNVQASDGTYCDRVEVTWAGVSGATGYDVLRDGTPIGSSTASPYADTTASAGVTYQYSVRARNACGTGPTSATNSGYRGVAPTTAPTNVQASDGTLCDRVEVTWTAVSGATGYDALRDGTQIGSPASSPYSDTTASPGVTYQYSVRARNACGTGPTSATNSGFRAVTPTSAPTNVQASDGTYCDRVEVTWAGVSGATGYDVLRDGTQIGSPTASPYSDTTASPGVTYQYSVRARNACGTGPTSATNSGYRGVAPTTAPTNVQASDGTYCDRVEVTWTVVSGATGYDVLRDGTQIGSPTSSPYSDFTASPGVTYQYALRARNVCGTGPTSITDPGYRGATIGAVTGLTASDGTDCTRILVSWNPVSGATGYELFWNTTNSQPATPQVSLGSGVTSYSHTGTSQGQTLYYWIRATGSCGTGPTAGPETGYRGGTIGAVTGLSASDGTDCTRILVTWNALPGATGYDLYWSTTNSLPATPQSQVGPGQTSYVHSGGPSPSQVYYFWIRATSECGPGSVSGPDTGYRASAPGTVGNLSASAGTDCARVLVTWAATASATGYDLFWNTTNSMPATPQVQLPAGQTTYSHSAAAAGQTYYYWIRATNACGAGPVSGPVTGYRGQGGTPVIATHPQRRFVSRGDASSFSVVMTDAGPYQYQWRRNGIPLVNGGGISGATAATLSIYPTAPEAAGMFDVVVRSTCSTVEITSNSAQLAVDDCPIGWRLATISGPSPRQQVALTGFGINPGVLLFGGRTVANSPLGETWKWDNGTWTQVSSTGPAARFDSAMSPDLQAGAILLFGGRTSSAPFVVQSDTWRWTGSQWSQVSPAAAPPPRGGHRMAYDSRRGRVVLFGGYDSNQVFLGDTWEWNGSVWQQVASTGPAPRLGHVMAYDSGRGRVVLFGGGNATTRFGDTWEWNGSAWQQVASTGPSLRSYAAMAYSPTRARCVLVGGLDAGTNFVDDTWEWEGAVWRFKASFGPSPRYGHEAAYDAGRDRILVFGGQELTGARSNETWEWFSRTTNCCVADWNGDDAVDFNDFLAFLNDFNRGALRADLDGDGNVDFNDVLGFLNAFNSGC